MSGRVAKQRRRTLWIDCYSDGYSPGGRTASSKRRARARKAGFASGARRRALSTAPPRQRFRSRAQALALSYRIRQVSPERFEALYRAMCEREGLPFDRRGMRTALELYRADMRAYRAQGQDHETTNAQRARALEQLGRPRCARTVQRTRKRLEAMGLVYYHHVRRSGHLRIAGQLDSLRVQLLCAPGANVTPPTGAGAAPFGRCAPALPKHETYSGASADRIPPPAAADADRPAARGAGGRGEANVTPSATAAETWTGNEAARLAGEAFKPPSDDRRGELERQIAFRRLKASYGFASERHRWELSSLKAELRRLDEERGERA